MQYKYIFCNFAEPLSLWADNARFSHCQLAKYWTRIDDIPELLIFVILSILWATKLQIEGFFFTKRVWNNIVLAYEGICDVILCVWTVM